MMRGITIAVAILIFLLSGQPIIAQNNPPVALGEIVIPYFNYNVFQNDTTIYVNLLLNDYDPDGDPIEIAEIKNRIGQEYAIIDFSDSLISLTMNQTRIIEQGYEYRVREKQDTASLSNWATLIFNPGYGPDFPIAWNDTVIGMRGYPLNVNVLENDVHPAGDSLFIFSPPSNGDSTVLVNCDPYNNKYFVRRSYMILDSSGFNERMDQAIIFVELLNNEFYDSLDINNINARFNCFGNHFWDMDSKQHFKVPTGSDRSSVVSQAFWIGGLDENENLHVAGDRYRAIGEDYWPGPVSDIYDSAYDSRWLHVWKLNRTDIEYHKTHWWEADYEPIPDILSWPGNGNLESGQSEFIAPFEDQNGNGIYEPLLGDAPIIKGDQSLFFVFNDARHPHTESGGIPLGIEVRAMAYAFDAPEDSVLWNTIFWHYDIENRSDTNYHNVYAGIFTDTDLGYGWDDRIECDVENGMYFVYNGTENDEGGPEQPGYGEHPPALGIQILAGPFLESDGLDNPKFDLLGNQIVDESINGLNFGDGTIDNERLGMTGFMYFNGGGAGWMSDPTYPLEYYNLLRSYWHDNVKLQYGGYGHPSALAEGPDCNFMWPRDTDPYNWGTYGLWPNGGYNQNGFYWTEEQVGANPNDRRGMGRTGPFTLSVGQVQSIDVAMPWARDYDGTAWSSALLLKERAALLKQMFQDDPDFFSEVLEADTPAEGIVINPNPVTDKCLVTFNENIHDGELIICNCSGQMVYSQKFTDSNQIKISLNNLSKGIYIIRLIQAEYELSTKFVKD